jgi:hypothetical protein
MYFTPEEWRQFFENYKIFIGHYADIAHRYHVQQLAIGTELITADTKSVRTLVTRTAIRSLVWLLFFFPHSLMNDLNLVFVLTGLLA